MPHAYEKDTRQLAIRWPKEKGGWHYCVLVFNLTDLMIFQLVELLMPRKLTDQDLFSAIMKAYNLRSGGVETSIKNSKQGLGLNSATKNVLMPNTCYSCRKLWYATLNPRRLSYFWKDSS
jgi:hypothetical protein